MKLLLFTVFSFFAAVQANQDNIDQFDFQNDPTHILLQKKLIELNKQVDDLEYQARYAKMNISDSREVIYAALMTRKTIVDFKTKIRADFPHIRHLDGCYTLLQAEVNNYADQEEFLYYSRLKQYLTALDIVLPILRDTLEPKGTDERFLCELNEKNCQEAGYNVTYLDQISGDINTYRKHFDSMATYYILPSRLLQAEASIDKSIIEPVKKCYILGQPKSPVFIDEE